MNIFLALSFPSPPAIRIGAQQLHLSSSADLCSGSNGRLHKLCKEGRLREAIQTVERLLNQRTRVSFELLTCLLQGCIIHQDLDIGRQVQSIIIKNDLQRDTILGCLLIRMFACCASMADANHVFSSLPEQNVYAWTALILAHSQLAYFEQAIRLYERMQNLAIKPNSHTFVAVLKSCISLMALHQGKLIHTDIIKQGLVTNLFVGSILIDMYAKCGCVYDARKVFDNLVSRDAISWSAMIAGYVQHGHAIEALLMFKKLHEEATIPNKSIFLSILKACACLSALDQGKLIHAEIIKIGLELDLLVGSALVDMYVKCGNLDEACKIFQMLPIRSVVSWSAIISGYASHGNSKEALKLFEEMQQDGTVPDKVIYVCILKACANTGVLTEGKIIHAAIIKQWLQSDVFVESAVLDMYAKCSRVEDAKNTLDRMQMRDVVAWSAMIAGYTDSGYFQEALNLFQKMKEEGAQPDKVTFLSVLKACASSAFLHEGKLIHAEVMKRGFQQDLFIRSALIDMYATCGCVQDAREVFDQLLVEDVALWNAMIAGYADHGYGQDALRLFKKMQQVRIQSDTITVVCALKACSSIADLDEGKQIYIDIMNQGLESDLIVGNALVDMFAKCGSSEDAHAVFRRLWKRDVVSWSAVISVNIELGHCQEALCLFKEMHQEGVKPDAVTFVCIVRACTGNKVLDLGELIHGEIIIQGLDADVLIGSTLIDMYAKCGSLHTACKVFDNVPAKDAVAWNAMIGGHLEHEESEKALKLLQEMQEQGTEPDEITFIYWLKACSSVTSLDRGRLIHSDLTSWGYDLHLPVGNTLVDMYAKCGSLEDACKAFDLLPLRTAVSWNTMIAGNCDHGHFHIAKRYVQSMQQEGVRPDCVSFICLLSACSHGGLVEEGHYCFKLMTEYYGLTPTMQHYVCMVDALGRAGCLNDAEDLILRIPLQPDHVLWMSLLGSCAKHGSVLIGRRAFDHLVQLDSGNAAEYVIMSNIYATNHMWDGAQRMHERKWADQD